MEGIRHAGNRGRAEASGAFVIGFYIGLALGVILTLGLVYLHRVGVRNERRWLGDSLGSCRR